MSLDAGDNDAANGLLNALGFCGCGQPDDALDLTLRILRNFVIGLAAPDAEREATWKDREELLGGKTGYAPTLGLITLYHLDSVGLLEHGSQIYGSWLTEKGRDVLARLEAWKSQRPDEAP